MNYGWIVLSVLSLLIVRNELPFPNLVMIVHITCGIHLSVSVHVGTREYDSSHVFHQ